MRSTVTRLLVGGVQLPESVAAGERVVEAEATRLLAFLATDSAERRLAFVDLDAA